MRHDAHQRMGQIGLLQIGEFLLREGKLHSGNCAVDMGKFGGTHHRRCHLGKQPSQGDFGHAHAMGIGQLGNPLEDKRILRGRGIVFEMCIRDRVGGGRPFHAAGAG